jgi:hypothetical protein
MGMIFDLATVRVSCRSLDRDANPPVMHRALMALIYLWLEESASPQRVAHSFQFNTVRGIHPLHHRTQDAATKLYP